MIPKLIDSHCHLDLVDDLPEALSIAQEHEMIGLTTIGTEFSKAETQIALTRHSSSALKIWCSIGTHPDSVSTESFATAEEIAKCCAHASVIGIGESGLDFLHGDMSVRDRQERYFRAHIQAARLTNLPLIIHSRNADDAMIRVLTDETSKGGSFPFLLHCFASGPELAKVALSLGGYISFSGILTFPKAEAIRDVARDVPTNRLLVETDSPYLAPVPKRGKANTPAYVTHTAERLAQLRGTSNAQIAAETTANFFRVFKKAA